MNDSKFPKLLDYQALKAQYGEEDIAPPHTEHNSEQSTDDRVDFSEEVTVPEQKKPGLTGTRLRSYAFAVLTRKEYSKADLTEKLALYAEDRDEVIALVDELARENYQSDQRVAETLLSSQKRKGKGPNRIKLALKNKKLNTALIQEELKETDWSIEAYTLKVKKFGKAVEKDPKLKAKQIRFLQYRGFDLDTIFKVITRTELDDD